MTQSPHNETIYSAHECHLIALPMVLTGQSAIATCQKRMRSEFTIVNLLNCQALQHLRHTKKTSQCHFIFLSYFTHSQNKMQQRQNIKPNEINNSNIEQSRRQVRPINNCVHRRLKSFKPLINEIPQKHSFFIIFIIIGN